MNTGLTQRDTSTIHAILQRYPEITRVVLFGSRAKGTAKPGSDIDLAIMNDGVTEEIILRLKQEFEESSLPYTVDVINYPALDGNALKEHIDRVGILLYTR